MPWDVLFPKIHILQLRSASQITSHDSRHVGRAYRYPSRYEVDCRIDRREGIKAEPSKNLRSPQFKLRHYR